MTNDLKSEAYENFHLNVATMIDEPHFEKRAQLF